MRISRRLEEVPRGLPRPVAAIGNFDGMHLGHREILEDLVRRAGEAGGTPTVVTFHPHPSQILAPGNAPRQIQTLEQKLASFQDAGVQLAVVIPFTPELARMSARDFAVRVLWQTLGLCEICVGPNFAFGHRREGSFSLLREVGAELGFSVRRSRQVQFRGNRVSSTAVRQALMTGNVSLARRLLGRPYALRGEIVHGTHTGTSLGVPTANLATKNELIPRRGVYVTLLSVGSARRRAVTNIGYRPTMEPSGVPALMSIETHVLDFNEGLYGCEVTLEFLLGLREERRFAGSEGLLAQIGRDVARARRYFAWLEPRCGAL